jgi:hypothetical protein
MDFRHSVEMTISREEFLRLLPAAVGAFEADGEFVRWVDQGRGWNIRVVPLPDLRLGSAAIPRHRVEFLLEACPAEEGAAFLERFHHAFLRGGG